MRRLLPIVILLPILALGCAAVPGSREPQPVVVDPQCTACVADCLRLGMLVETADAGNPSAYWAARRMLNRLNERALQLKATHIVWLHRTSNSAAIEAYRCPAP
jgi:hypothetical protein